MGMRIHTGIGYGLLMTEVEKDFLKARIEEEDFSEINQAILADIRSQDQTSMRSSDYIFFGEEYQARAEENHTVPFDIQSCFEYEEEFFYEDRIVFLPYPFGQEWTRWDDDLDYQQAQIFEKELGVAMTEGLWKESERSFYPYEGRYLIDHVIEGGYRIANDEERILRRGIQIPFIPEHIRFFVKHLLNVPEKELTNTFLKIRPVYYRYWA